MRGLERFTRLFDESYGCRKGGVEFCDDYLSFWGFARAFLQDSCTDTGLQGQRIYELATCTLKAMTGRLGFRIEGVQFGTSKRLNPKKA